MFRPRCDRGPTAARPLAAALFQAALGLAALIVPAGSARASAPPSPGARARPMRAAVRPRTARAFYRSQLLPGLDLTVGERIELPGRTIRTKVDGEGRLLINIGNIGNIGGKCTRSDAGGAWRTVRASPRTVTVALEREEAPPFASPEVRRLAASLALPEGGRRRTLSVKLYLVRSDGGEWTYRNVTQLEMRIGGDTVVVVDANGNGVYNEPGVDGMTWQGGWSLFPLPSRSERWCTADLEITGLTFGPWGEDAIVVARPLSTRTPAALGVLRGVNEERVKLGLTPRAENGAASVPLQRHCDYMSANGALRHREERARPGYSVEGHEAGMRSILSRGTPAAGVAAMMLGTFYHRHDVVRPRARSFGVGYSGRCGGIDGRSDLDRSMEVPWPFLCPAPGQEDVPLEYQEEEPDATPGDDSAGFPITAYFDTPTLGLVRHSLRIVSPDGSAPAGAGPGSEVECYTYEPRKGAQVGIARSQRCVCLIPREPLARGTTYEVALEIDVDDARWTCEWSFTTVGASKRRRR